MIRIKQPRIIKWLIVAMGILVGISFLLRSSYQTPNDKALIKNYNDKINQVGKSFDTVINDTSKRKSQYHARYIHDLSHERIERLLETLVEKEKSFSELMKHLGLIDFDSLLSGKNDLAMKDYEQDRDRFLKVIGNRVTITDEFVNYLYNLSDFYSFEKPRKNVQKSKFDPSFKKIDKPVIVTAANDKFYHPLQSTVYHIHKYLPDYEIIVYDLGLDESMYNMTLANCKCTVKKFNTLYAHKIPHIKNLMTYAWKPILIQETLKSHQSVIYIDSSIRFSSDEIKSQLATLTDVGMLTQFIGLNFNCYTDRSMFNWFGESSDMYQDFWTIEANIIFFHRNFLTQLLMKAWVTCALDKTCIAPEGSRVNPCCGCHRYDQAALTLISSFFYGHPRDKFSFLPAYSFTTHESYFFSVNRYEGREYFTKKI